MCRIYLFVISSSSFLWNFFSFFVFCKSYFRRWVKYSIFKYKNEFFYMFISSQRVWNNEKIKKPIYILKLMEKERFSWSDKDPKPWFISSYNDINMEMNFSFLFRISDITMVLYWCSSWRYFGISWFCTRVIVGYLYYFKKKWEFEAFITLLQMYIYNIWENGITFSDLDVQLIFEFNKDKWEFKNM